MRPEEALTTPFTLLHGVIPDNLRPDVPDGAPDHFYRLDEGATGWWVVGVDWDDADDRLPYVLDTGEDTATLAAARRVLDPYVQAKAAQLLKVQHDIRVVKWHRIGPDQYEPELQHEKYTLDIRTVDGRLLTFQDLSHAKVEQVTRDVEEFDSGPDPSEEGMPKRRTTMVHLNLFDLPGRMVTVAVRIATIVDIREERHTEPVTKGQLDTMRWSYAVATR